LKFGDSEDKDFSESFLKRAISLREGFSRIIAQKMHSIDANDPSIVQLLRPYQTIVYYLPIYNPKLAVILTQSVLRSTERFLACVLDIRNRNIDMNIDELYDKMSNVTRSQDQPKILRPFISMDMEDLNIMV
jgi:hypothetical protein